MVDALFLQNSKGITNKIPQPENPPTESLEKKSLFLPYCGDEESDADYGPHHGYFHHTAEMKRHIL